MFCTSGSMDQLYACGLKTVQQQMQMRKLLLNSSHAYAGSSVSGTDSCVTTVPESPPAHDRKLKKKELQKLTPEDKRIYLMQ